MLVLAISNGYVGNIACMYGPKVVKPEYQVQTSQSFEIAQIY